MKDVCNNFFIEDNKIMEVDIKENFISCVVVVDMVLDVADFLKKIKNYFKQESILWEENIQYIM